MDFGCTGGRPKVHLGSHVIDIFLRVLYHLDRLIPFLLEVRLRLLDLLLLDLNPSIDLSIFELVSTRRVLLLLEQLPDYSSFTLLLELENLLSKLDEP